MIAPEHCDVVVDLATANQVTERLFPLAREATDTLVFYYAGHGLPDDHNVLHLGMTRSTRLDPEALSLSIDTVRRAITKSPATVKLCILDCCFSGLALQGMMASGESVIQQQVRIAGAYTLTATPATRMALAPPGERYTAFSGVLLSILERGIPGPDRYLSMATIYDELHRRLLAADRPEPKQQNVDTAAQLWLLPNAAWQPQLTSKPGPSRAQTARGRYLTTERIDPIKTLDLPSTSPLVDLAFVLKTNDVLAFDHFWRRSWLSRKIRRLEPTYGRLSIWTQESSQAVLHAEIPQPRSGVDYPWGWRVAVAVLGAAEGGWNEQASAEYLLAGSGRSVGSGADFVRPSGSPAYMCGQRRGAPFALFWVRSSPDKPAHLQFARLPAEPDAGPTQAMPVGSDLARWASKITRPIFLDHEVIDLTPPFGDRGASGGGRVALLLCGTWS